MYLHELQAKRTAEKAALMPELLKLSHAEKIDMIRKAREYRSGSDSCNSLYMGGMALTSLRHALGGKQLDEIPDTPEGHRLLDSGLDVCWHYISYMMQHPTKKCPTCGGIMSA